MMCSFNKSPPNVEMRGEGPTISWPVETYRCYCRRPLMEPVLPQCGTFIAFSGHLDAWLHKLDQPAPMAGPELLLVYFQHRALYARRAVPMRLWLLCEWPNEPFHCPPTCASPSVTLHNIVLEPFVGLTARPVHLPRRAVGYPHLQNSWC